VLISYLFIVYLFIRGALDVFRENNDGLPTGALFSKLLGEIIPTTRTTIRKPTTAAENMPANISLSNPSIVVVSANL